MDCMEKISIAFLMLLLSCSSFLKAVVHAQNQSGFLSMDCGIPPDSVYRDPTTGITYRSDSGFIDTGIANNISAVFQYKGLPRQFMNVRSFPQGIRNCYTFSPTLDAKGSNNSKYLVRARFMYGNYDSMNRTPSFDLYAGSIRWDTVRPYNSSVIVDKEIIVNYASRNFICLVNTGSGTPFISALEFRLLNSSIYMTNFGSLVNLLRIDMGTTTSDTYTRYDDDIYDRIWTPIASPSTVRNLRTSFPVVAGNVYRPPSKVMQTATTNAAYNETVFTINWKPDGPFYLVLFYMHFSEIEPNATRQFNIYINGEFFYGPLTPRYLVSTTIFSRSPRFAAEYNITLNRTSNSSLPPLINGIEAYALRGFLESLTEESDVSVLQNIKTFYDLNKAWGGDPCSPKNYSWEGVKCSYIESNPPRIASLNLSSSGLNGTIAPYISNLTMIQSLDLSNNRLTGSVPDSLADLPSLTSLFLTGNNFTSPLPRRLIDRSQNRSLLLIVDADLCSPRICGNGDLNSGRNNGTTGVNQSNGTGILMSNGSSDEGNAIIVSAVVSVSAFAAFVAVAVLVFWLFRKRKRGWLVVDGGGNDVGKAAVTLSQRQFSYADVLTITNGLQRMIGEGRRNSKVFHGTIESTDVAVKLLGLTNVVHSQFQTEAEILCKLRHENVASVIGYCCDDTKLGLVSQYVSNGSLSNQRPFSWRTRLSIAVDIAKGLKCLHADGVIHGNLKPSNVLLDGNLQAKITDFGFFQRGVPAARHGALLPLVPQADTYEYLDPEYFVSNMLDVRSDVFSLGVVLLELISGRPAIAGGCNETHIAVWAAGLPDAVAAADPDLRDEDFDTVSLEEAFRLALSCSSIDPDARPDIARVLLVLQDCLTLEVWRTTAHPL